MSNEISSQQRAVNFARLTRQHIQTLGTFSGTANSHIEFEVPKARFLQSINLLVKVKLKKNVASNWEFNDKNTLMNLYNVLKRVGVNYNSGFNPFVAPGKDIAILNMLRVNPDVILPSCTFDKSLCTVYGVDTYEKGDYKFTVPSSTDLDYYFRLELPLTLNERDTQGLIMVQNAQTLLTVAVDIADRVNNQTVESVEIKPELITFSIPPIKEAIPDLTVLKIVDSRKETFTAGGSNLIKLPTGQIYRKMIFYFENEAGEPLNVDDFNSNIEILFNTADVPYSIDPYMMRLRAVSMFGNTLPEGYYVLDLSTAGVPNMAGSRDYIDCEQLTSCEVRFSTFENGKITTISERISRLTVSK